MDISAALKMHRKHKKLSQNELAKQAGVNRQIIGKLENENYDVLFSNFLNICNELELDLILIPR